MTEQPVTAVERQAQAFQQILAAQRSNSEDPVRLGEVIETIAQPLLADHPQLAQMLSARTARS